MFPYCKFPYNAAVETQQLAKILLVGHKSILSCHWSTTIWSVFLLVGTISLLASYWLCCFAMWWLDRPCAILNLPSLARFLEEWGPIVLSCKILNVYWSIVIFPEPNPLILPVVPWSLGPQPRRLSGIFKRWNQSRWSRVSYLLFRLSFFNLSCWVPPTLSLEVIGLIFAMSETLLHGQIQQMSYWQYQGGYLGTHGS